MQPERESIHCSMNYFPVIIVTDRETHKSRGFGYVVFTNEEDAKEAMQSMAGERGKVRFVYVFVCNSFCTRAAFLHPRFICTIALVPVPTETGHTKTPPSPHVIFHYKEKHMTFQSLIPDCWSR